MKSYAITRKPTLLVSYAFIKEAKPLPGTGFRDWILDSGAYTALNSGKKVNLERFTQDVVAMQKADSRLAGAFALDVIGDPEKTIENAEFMRKHGAEVIPTWHAGSHVSYLRHIAKGWKRIAVGGLVKRANANRGLDMDASAREHWIAKAFAEVWPHWIHGFGCSGDDVLENYPFASVDSTTWRLRPSMYGSWKRFGAMPIRLKARTAHLLKTEALYFLEKEEWLTARWRKEHALIGVGSMSVRLASQPSDRKWFDKHFGDGVVEDGPEPEMEEVTKAVKKSTDCKPMEDKWENYWKERNFKRDPLADAQPHLDGRKA